MEYSLFLFYFILLPSLISSLPHKPNPITIPINKPPSSHQYIAEIKIGTPNLPINLVLDLNGPFLWFDCSSIHVSSSHQLITFNSIHCSTATASSNCTLYPENRITQSGSNGELAQDIIALDLDRNSILTVDSFLFSCAPSVLLKGLASGAKGMLGLGRTRLGLPSQLGVLSHHQRKFAMCLSSTNGFLLFGPVDNCVFNSPRPSPKEIGQFRSIGNSLTYTPLVSHQDEYYINVKSILINGRRISINKSLLSLTKISTIVPYTTMETAIYNTFTKGYIIAASSMNLTKVAPVEPFSVCFSTRGVGETVVGPKVPEIELGLQSGMVKWKINGRNSMVKVSDEVMCLAFLDGGLNLKDSIVIGGYQLEDNLFEFNLGTSMLGFSSSLLGRGTSCSDFRLNSMTTELF